LLGIPSEDSLNRNANPMLERWCAQHLGEAMGGRPKSQIVLNEAKREQLEAGARRRKTA
jgi:hypothetical protein